MRLSSNPVVGYPSLQAASFSCADVSFPMEIFWSLILSLERSLCSKIGMSWTGKLKGVPIYLISVLYIQDELVGKHITSANGVSGPGAVWSSIKACPNSRLPHRLLLPSPPSWTRWAAVAFSSLSSFSCLILLVFRPWPSLCFCVGLGVILAFWCCSLCRCSACHCGGRWKKVLGCLCRGP